ncbi:hypothetical protein K437DRAFT_225874 [Tilletiaria anomala UBC 951]|uniref:Uncharacterized protein n=1 Tax=Tilletiaria anomala (strain ATCC 24038 / CBS 436.72 / UBC 951) TaxID=1037660 RepID=A0A066VMM1_TILAU|nr:uncharacterized protein K437DRAFT_225874 [Tilletiaria anomala UBC 951]KDN42987.1 hypothetical protein K437DRAFT_225874 [Tilletiaria anomala UBC 951]
MAGLSGQMQWVMREFQALLKDRQTISGEVMNEYEQKFVLPRAMPEVRDACVMTSEAEMIGVRDWQLRQSAPSQTPTASMDTTALQVKSASKSARQGRKTGGGESLNPW